MLAKRIIPCLDVKDGNVVKGVRFRDHQIVGDILELANYYCSQGADELVFYDITASTKQATVSKQWVCRVAEFLDIPFCVAGGIRSLNDAEAILNAGADKISINSPALENPKLIDELVRVFGSQCVVIGVDSVKDDKDFKVCQYTGDSKTSRETERFTLDWVSEVQDRGAGELVLNCMDQDGVRKGYDITQLQAVREKITIPLIASGGAGSMDDFVTVFNQAKVDGALAASIFHRQIVFIPELKRYLKQNNIEVRL